MPVTNRLIRLKMIEAGLDPDQGEEIPLETPVIKDQQNPVANPTPVVSSNKSALTALRQETLRNAPSATLGGLAAGALSVPFTPIVGIPLGIGVGMGARKLQDMAIETFAPEQMAKEYRESEIENLRDNKLASTAGQILSSGAVVGPSISALKPAGRAISKVLQGVRPDSSEVGAVIGAGIGAGLPTGIRATFDPNVTKGELALEALGGLLMNKSTKLGQAYGIPEVDVTAPPVKTNDKDLQAAQARGVRIDAMDPVTVQPDKGGPLLSTEDIQTGIYDTTGKQTKTVLPDPSSETAALNQINEEIQVQAKNLELQRKIKAAELKAQKEAARLAKLYKDEQAQAKAKEEVLAKERQEGSEDLYVAAFNKMEPEAFAKLSDEAKTALRTGYKNRVDALDKTTVVPPEDTIIPEVPPSEAPKMVEDAEGKLQSVSKTQLLPGEVDPTLTPVADPVEPIKLDPNKALKGIQARKNFQQNQQAIKQEQPASNLSALPTKEWSEAFKKLGVKRGVQVDDTGRVINKKGEEIAGDVYLREGLNETLARVNPNTAKVDTYPHEILHPFLVDLQKFGSKFDQKLVARGEDAVSKTKAYQDWLAQNPDKTPNEFLTTLTGEDVVRRVLNTDNKGTFKNWLGDFWSHIKTRFNKASDEDYIRVLSNKVIGDRPLAETVGKPLVKLVAGIELQNQDQSRLANVTSRGEFDTGMEGLPKFHFYDLQEDIPGHPKGSTVSQKTLRDKGYKIPEGVPQDDAASLEAKIKAFDEFKNKNKPLESPTSRLDDKDLPAPKDTLPEDKSILAGVRGLRNILPEIDKIRNAGLPKLADASTKFYEDYTSNVGELVNRFQLKVREVAGLNKSVKTYVSQNTPELDNVRDWFWAQKDGEKTPKLTANEEKIKQAWIETSRQVRDKQNTIGTLEKKTDYDDNYFPQTVSPDALKFVTQMPNSDKALALKRDWIEYYTKKLGSAKEAEKFFEEFKKSFSRDVVDTASQFGPIDKAEGLGLPKSWRETNFLDITGRYLDRVSRRFAYETSIKPIEPEFMSNKGNDAVGAVFRDITGNRRNYNPKINALFRLVRSTRLGTMTGAKDLVSNLVLGFQHQENPLAVVARWKQLWDTRKQNLADAYESGRLRVHLNSLEFDGGYDDTIRAIKRMSDIASDLSGRNFFETVARGWAFGEGKFTALDYHEQMLKGKVSQQAKNFFNNFAKDIDLSKPLSPEDLKKIAGRYVDDVQGTYDYRGLPRQTVEGTVAPYLSLARWSVEKFNNFEKRVVRPALKGDIKPLLMSTIGMTLGGTAVNELVELMSGRDNKTATIDELKNLDKNQIQELTYKLAGLAATSGHMGIMSDVFKSIMDVTYGKELPQTFNNILFDSAGDTATLVGSFAEALIDEGPSIDLVTKFLSKFAEDNVQTIRLLGRFLSAEKQEDIDKANKLRDLRVFKRSSGEDIVDMRQMFNLGQLENLDLKQFKRTQDINEARKLLYSTKKRDGVAGLLEKALENAGESEEKLKKELSRIKRNSYQTMPNPDTMPESFLGYIKFLRKTQGKDEAVNRLLDYLERNDLNDQKADLVP